MGVWVRADFVSQLQLHSFRLVVSVAQLVSDCTRDPGSPGLLPCACCLWRPGARASVLAPFLPSEGRTRSHVTGREKGQSAHWGWRIPSEWQFSVLPGS